MEEKIRILQHSTYKLAFHLLDNLIQQTQVHLSKKSTFIFYITTLKVRTSYLVGAALSPGLLTNAS